MRAKAARAGQTVQRAFRRLQPAPSPRWPALSPVARRVEQCVRVLDGALVIPGTRLKVGLDPVLGLALPGVGDAVSGVVSLSVLFLALQYRVPAPILGRMVWNVAVDSTVGAIPVVGDIFDFTWKANELNFELLMLHRGDLPKHGTLIYWLTASLFVLLGLVAVAAPIGLVIWCVLWLRRDAA
jgi:hypothetical protein